MRAPGHRFLTCLATVVTLAPISGCTREELAADIEQPVEVIEPPPPEPLEWALALHGGLLGPGEIDPEAYYVVLTAALAEGADILAGGGAALDAVEATVRRLEDDPRFNAGRGAAFTDRGTHELDAAIMDGRTLAAGSVAGVRNVRNPISLARQVMERSSEVLLTGSSADEYARDVGVRRAPQDYFTTDHRYQQWQQERRRARRSGSGGGTPSDPEEGSPGQDSVGAVALDRYGNVASASSSGGNSNRRYGAVGGASIIGAGAYADNRTAALACTGNADELLRHSVAHDISARIEQGATLEEAARTAVQALLGPGAAGVIGVDERGTLALVFSSSGMLRGAADAAGRFEVGVGEELRSGRPEASSESVADR